MGRSIALRVCAAAAGLGMTGTAHAWHFEQRFVERIGNTDVLLGSSVFYAGGTTHRIRVQFGVFDDADGPAPVDGFAGWLNGRVDTAGGGEWRRTPGRLPPFNFTNQPTNNGVPVQDPFTSLSDIDDARGITPLPWFCDANGDPLPRPQPVDLGFRSFVSTFEMSVTLPAQFSTITVSTQGSAVGLTNWRFESTPTPPDCEAGEPGSVVYVPMWTESRMVTGTLRVVPEPSTAGPVWSVVLMNRRRRG